MAFEQEGTVHKIFDTESKTDSFQAREFVIKLDGNYPQFIKFQLTQDRCDLVNNFKEGDQIKVSFDLRGREWNEKYFTNLNAWRVEAVQTDQIQESGPPGDFAPIAANTEPQTTNKSETLSAEDFEDLPF